MWRLLLFIVNVVLEMEYFIRHNIGMEMILFKEQIYANRQGAAIPQYT